MAVLKVFADRRERPQALQGTRLVAAYDAFAVVEADAALAASLAQRFPVEDITDQYRLPLGGTLKDPLQPAARSGARAARREFGPVDDGPHHYVVQFIGPVKPAWLDDVRRAGATVREPMGGFAHVVRADAAALRKVSALDSVRWVGHLPHADRVADNLLHERPSPLPRRRVVPGALQVEVFGAEDVERVAQAARELGFEVLSASRRARVLAVQSTAGAAKLERQVKALAAVHGVRFVREKVLPRPSNDVAARVMGTRYAAALPTGARLSGRGEVVAVCDTGLDSGDPAAVHADFAGRVVAIRSYPIAPFWADYVTNPGADDGPADVDSGHGTHVAGSVLGIGAASANDAVAIRGLAPGAKLVFQAIEQEMKWKPTAPPSLRAQRYVLAGLELDLTPLFDWAREQGARIHSNSWGGGDAGAYDDQCRQFDDFVWTHKDFCFVVAAGNDGTDQDRDGVINATSVSSPGTSKNVVTVGASENARAAFNAETYGRWWPDDFAVAPFRDDPMADDEAQVVAFSSRGPTLDGRVKPDVVAPGTFILSTRSTRIASNNFAWGAHPANRLYFHMGGTSMATPLVAGALALLREHLRRRRRMANPSAALLKALLVAGAERLPGTQAPQALLDDDQGFGRVNVDRSLEHVVGVFEGRALRTGEVSTRRFTLPATRRTLRVAMAYTDYPGDTLVNNLNLLVRDPAGGRHVGNQAAGAGPVLSMDGRNNVEVVQARGRKGQWTVTVAASNVSRGPQDFALAIVLV